MKLVYTFFAVLLSGLVVSLQAQPYKLVSGTAIVDGIQCEFDKGRVFYDNFNKVYRLNAWQRHPDISVGIGIPKLEGNYSVQKGFPNERGIAFIDMTTRRLTRDEPANTFKADFGDILVSRDGNQLTITFSGTANTELRTVTVEQAELVFKIPD